MVILRAVAERVYLIPGFFGFANLGDFKYFAQVQESLGRSLADRGREAEILQIPTIPTASLRRRAGRLLEVLAETSAPGDALHLIGHSTGGLDARLLMAPGVAVRSAVADVEPVIGRVRSVVSVASPHHGTPTAALFNSLLGQQLLEVMSITTLHTIRLGSIPLPALLALVGLFDATGLMRKVSSGILDQVYRQVLRDFTPERQAEIEEFFSMVSDDQALMPQLTPEGMDVFAATVRDRDAVRYGCVIAQAKPPAVSEMLRVGFDPTDQASYMLFRVLHRLGSTLPQTLLPTLDAQAATMLERAYGAVPGVEANDAMVPVLSQVHGEVIHAAWSDHLDVVGHFRGSGPGKADWLYSRSEFDAERLRAVWADVAAFIAGSA